MVTTFAGPSPGRRAEDAWRLDQIQWFWQQLFVGEDSGETTWEELRDLHGDVKRAIAEKPADISLAETLTAYAMALMSGLKNS